MDSLLASFFQSVSFDHGQKPQYARLYDLFIPSGLLIKNSLATPEVTTVRQFIEPREQLVSSGQLTAFKEIELAAITEGFGNVAHRFSTYEKSGTQNGAAFTLRGMISTQCILTPQGWRISAMAWDDERAGLTIPARYVPGGRAVAP
jgi:hypothetical protein